MQRKKGEEEEVVPHSWAPYVRPLTKSDIGKRIVKTKPDSEGDYLYCGGEVESGLLIDIKWSDTNSKKIEEMTVQYSISGEKEERFPFTLKEKGELRDWVVLEEVKHVPFNETEYMVERSIKNKPKKSVVDDFILDPYPPLPLNWHCKCEKCVFKL